MEPTQMNPGEPKSGNHSQVCNTCNLPPPSLQLTSDLHLRLKGLKTLLKGLKTLLKGLKSLLLNQRASFHNSKEEKLRADGRRGSSSNGAAEEEA
ncbi:hypothetical protein EYF80_050429 [Liparis tanakae]|uniref:Uncharacterized protein n=1 Tax=Liparis tanakae TaxID=230148 RepID=A0A4Z2FE10_9TELE|nr:hypothetical protein EYF80_050429 [Liparis tanakae]